MNDVELDSLDGELEIKGRNLSFSRMLTVARGANQVRVGGSAVLADDLIGSQLSLNAELSKGDVASLLDTAGNIYLESAKYITPPSSGTVAVNRKKIKFYPPASSGEVYAGEKADYFLKQFEKISAEVDAYMKQLEIPAAEKSSGTISGKISLSGALNNPRVEFSGEIKKGAYGRYQFDSLTFKGEYLDDNLQLARVTVNNKDGKADIWGNVGLDGSLNLRVISAHLPLDVIRLAVNRPAEGWIDSTTSIAGSVSAPIVATTFKCHSGRLAGASFDELSGQVNYDSAGLLLNGIRMKKGKDLSRLEGFFDLNGNGELSATIEGETPGLAGLLTDEIQWRSGESSGEVTVSMTDGRLEAYGSLKISDAVVYVKRLDAEISGCNLDLIADGPSVIMNRLTGTWFGKSSRNQNNNLSFSGAIDLNTFDMTWYSADCHLIVDFPSIYQGELQVNDASLSGDPGRLLLAGKIDFNDGIIYLPKGGVSAPAASSGAGPVPLNFNLIFNLKKNVYLTAGDALTLDLNSIFINLEMSGKEITLAGTLSDPRLYGKVLFNQGSVSILNREFNLLTEDQQKQFYPNDVDKVSENYAQFNGLGVMPYLKLHARVDVETPDDSNPGKYKSVTIVSNIDGNLQAQEESNKLNIGFDAFTLDQTKVPAEMVLANYSDQDIKVLILPDYIRTLTGAQKGEVNTNSVVADYLNSRLQSLVFRNLERGIEKTLGLESLTLEYNFGDDIRHALGVQDSQKSGVGVGFVKGFFDKFYIDVRYSQGEVLNPESSAQESLNYQITYKLTSIWSLVYYSEPATVYDPNSGYYKYTLRAGYYF